MALLLHIHSSRCMPADQSAALACTRDHFIRPVPLQGVEQPAAWCAAPLPPLYCRLPACSCGGAPTARLALMAAGPAC